MKNTKKDGRMKHPAYSSWRGMKSRCYNPRNPKYDQYGGRGITVCDRWLKDFWAFANDIGPRPDGSTLDRINVNGNYEPSNCRWADRYIQARNVRRKLNGHVSNIQHIRPNCKLSKSWSAQITIKGKRSVKYFATENEAYNWLKSIT